MRRGLDWRDVRTERGSAAGKDAGAPQIYETSFFLTAESEANMYATYNALVANLMAEVGIGADVHSSAVFGVRTGAEDQLERTRGRCEEMGA